MDYQVQLIADSDLPGNQPWAIVRDQDRTIAFIKRSCLTGRVLANAWAAYRSLDSSQEERPQPKPLRLVS